MGYRELYTSAAMAGEEYNISDKGLRITPNRIDIQVMPGGTEEGQFIVAGPAGTGVTGILTSDHFHMQLKRDPLAENPDRISWRFDARQDSVYCQNSEAADHGKRAAGDPLLRVGSGALYETGR